MAPVYSTRFCELAAVTGGPVLAYTVPAGFVAVVKSLSIVWGDVTVSGLDAWFQTDLLTKLGRRTIAFPGSDPQYIGGSSVWFGTWVLEPAQTLSVQTAAGTCDFAGGGFLLSLP